MNFNLEAPINSVSFGNLTFGLTYELFKRGIMPNLLPIANNIDFSAFDKCGDDYKQYIQLCVNKFATSYNRNLPSLRLWHIGQSWHKVSDKQYLLTFFELDNLTPAEVNILNQQEKVFVTSQYSKEVFERCGVKVPIVVVYMGFDPIHFRNTNKKYFMDDTIVFSIFGKHEDMRKRHAKTIRAWIKKYGANKKYKLHVHTHNPFLKPEQMQAVYNQVFENQQPPWNVCLYPWMATNTLLNDCYGVCNIVIDMSGGESISLPSMTCVALGKHAVVHHNTGIKDWANEQNAVLVKSSGQIECVDNIFFHKGQQFNQGQIYDFNEDEFLDACDKAIERYKNNPINTAGLELKEKYSFKNAVDILLKELQ